MASEVEQLDVVGEAVVQPAHPTGVGIVQELFQLSSPGCRSSLLIRRPRKAMTGSGDDDGGGLHTRVSAEITSIELKGPNNAGQARSGPASLPRTEAALRRFAPFVPMVQSTHPRQRDDFRRG